MDTITVRVGQLRQHPAQMRTKLDPEEMANLVYQVGSQGLDPARPIVVARGEGDTYHVISGHRRWMAFMLVYEVLGELSTGTARSAVDATIDRYGSLMEAYEPLASAQASRTLSAMLFVGTPAEEVLALLSHNYGQAEPDPVGRALAFKAALGFGASAAVIGRAIGHNHNYVRNYLSLLELGPETQVQVQDGALPIGAAVEVAKLEPVRRQAVEAIIVGSETARTNGDVKNTCQKLAEFQGFPLKLEYTSAEGYHKDRIRAAVWEEALAADPGRAWAAAAEALVKDRHGFQDGLLITLLEGTKYLNTDAWYKLNWPALLHDYEPELTCDDCPIGRLPAQKLHSDLSTADYPCRGGKREPCMDAPANGAPFKVRVPYNWSIIALATSEEQLRELWEKRRQEEAAYPPAPDLVTGEGDVATGPILQQRTRIQHYIDHHGELNLSHPLSTPCMMCRHRTDESPTQNPDVPHCQWAARLRDVEFFVRAPAGGAIGPAIPVCRQFMALEGWTWAERLPEHAGDTLPRPMLLTFIDRLHKAAHNYVTQGQRTMLECLTGRPMTKSESHSCWFADRVAIEEPHLSDAQLMTLYLLAMAEWIASLAPGSIHSGYPLLIGDRSVMYDNVPWTRFWAERAKAEPDAVGELAA